MADENNIGASRLIGTNGLDQAVSSLTAQVNKMSADVGKLVGAMEGLTGSNNKSMGSSMSGANWNSGSNNAKYSNNGGGGSFSSTGQQGGGRGNGGGGVWSSLATSAANRAGGGAAGGSKIMAVGGAVAGVASALASYGNKNMSTNMQMDFYGMQQAQYGGVGPGGNQQASAAARKAVFSNNYLGTSVSDMAQAGYTNAYTFGAAAQNNGQANPLFKSQMTQVQGFGYNSPTLGSAGAAQANQETHTARSYYMSQALGLGPTIGPGGVQNSMGSIAQKMMANSLNPGQQYTTKNIAIALGQGGGLGSTLNYNAAQMGWSSSTVQEYRDYMTGLVSAQAKGISASQYDTLTQQASNGNKSAQGTLKKAGVGASMYESQRNLNSTGTTRQNDILNSLAPAFDTATKAVNDFSSALTSFLQSTGLDKAIGTGAGWSSALSNGLSGMSGGFGVVGGMLGAARLFGGGGGGFLGGLGNFARGGAGTAASSAAEGGLGAATTAGADGAYTITTLGAASAGTDAAVTGGAVAGGAAVGSAAVVGGVATLAVAGLGAGLYYGNKSYEASQKKNYKSGMVAPRGSGTTIPKGYTQADYEAFQTAENQAVIQARGSWTKAQAAKWETNYYNTHPAGSVQAGGGSSGVVGNTPGNGSKNVGANAASVIKAAETQLGVPYVWGGETPGKGMDCSGLTQWAYSQAGVKIPRVAADQQKAGTKVATNATQPGDLLFVGDPAHHVVMSIGGGKVIEAPHTGEDVRIRNFSPSEFTSATRIVGSVGNMASLTNGASSAQTLSTAQSRSGGDTGSLGGTSELSAIMSALAGGGGGTMPLTAGSGSAAGTSGSSAVGTTPAPNGKNDKGSLQAYAKSLLGKYGWGGQWNSFNALEMSEAGWNVSATNPSSGAYGLPQSLPASKMSSAGSDWKTNGDTQLVWMMDYIKGRYGSPDKAWSFHQKNNWYASGAWSIDQDQAAQVHKGEMILPAKQAETVRQAISSAITTGVGGGSDGTKTQVGGSLSIGTITVQMPQGYSGSKSDAQLAGKMIVDAITNDTRIKNLQKGQ